MKTEIKFCPRCGAEIAPLTSGYVCPKCGWGEGGSNDVVEIPFGAFDSELKGWEYTIPEGMEAKIENGKIIVQEKKNVDNILLDALLIHFQHKSKPTWNGFPVKDIIALIERLKNRVPPQETERLYIRTIKSLISDFIQGKEEIDTVYYQKIYDWLDGRHVEERKQTELTGNDEKMIDRCIELVLCAMPANISAIKEKEQCVTWLKSLLTRLKQEDRYTEGYRKGFAAAEKAYKNAVSYHMDNPNVYKLDPNVVIDSTTGGTYGACTYNCWKPSEEQVESLGHIINHYALLENHIRENIESLYNDLKKLM